MSTGVIKEGALVRLKSGTEGWTQAQVVEYTDLITFPALGGAIYTGPAYKVHILEGKHKGETIRVPANYVELLGPGKAKRETLYPHEPRKKEPLFPHRPKGRGEQLPATKKAGSFVIGHDYMGNLIITHTERPGDVFLQFESDRQLVYDILQKWELKEVEKGWSVQVKDTEPRASILDELWGSSAQTQRLPQTRRQPSMVVVTRPSDSWFRRGQIVSKEEFDKAVAWVREQGGEVPLAEPVERQEEKLLPQTRRKRFIEVGESVRFIGKSRTRYETWPKGAWLEHGVMGTVTEYHPYQPPVRVRGEYFEALEPWAVVTWDFGGKTAVLADQEGKSWERIMGSSLPQVARGKPTRHDVEIGTWAERDRIGIWITDKRTDKAIAEWWDEDAQEMFDQGFFKPGDIRHQAITGRAFEESVLDYAESVGILAGIRYLPQAVLRPKDAYYWTAVNKDTGEIVESFTPYTSSGRALRGGKAYASRHWKDTALVEVWRQPHRYSENLKIQPVEKSTLGG